MGLALIVWVAALPGSLVAAEYSPLTPEASSALADPGPVTLYSLEPKIRHVSGAQSLDRVPILGGVALDSLQAGQAVAAFRAAIANSGTPTVSADEVILFGCFEPRHAISIQSKGHRFDFLLCYACGHLEVFRDGELVSDVPAGGSPNALNTLLKTDGLPLSTSAP
jgi:hypothetical protein